MSSHWSPRPPILCLVTDRVALARALGDAGPALDALERQVAAAIDAGVDLVQLRERDLEAGRLRDLAGAWAERARGSATRIVVNDRLDVALIAGAHGVHLRGESYSPAAARVLSPGGFLVGRSVHSASAAASAAEADYLVIGTVFATPSKPGATPSSGRANSRARPPPRPPPCWPLEASRRTACPRWRRREPRALPRSASSSTWRPIQADECRRRVAGWRRVFDTNRPIS